MSARWSGSPSIWGPTQSVRMALLTISLAGVQLVWGFEMAYCSPYLLSLGLSKSSMSLVWIVGPLSGLITQPIVGAIADRSMLSWGRRRPFMILGTLLVGCGLLALGWVVEIVTFFFGESQYAKPLTILVAVMSIYVLDFSINAVQASCRALVVDSLPAQQQQNGSAWASRMIAIGNVAGYFVGTLDLKAIFGAAFGDTQIKKMCFLSFLTLFTTVMVTSLSVKESVLVSRRADDNEGLFAVLKTIFNTIFHLPTRIGAVCRIWFYAWIGWFPFMLYSTTFVGEVLQRYDTALRERLSHSTDVVGDIARVGSWALVIYSCVSLVASFTLPWLVHSPESEVLRRKRSQNGRFYAIMEFVELYRPDLVMAWAVGHVLFAGMLFLMLFVRSVGVATVLVGGCGIPWALMTWAPFSIVGEEINRLNSANSSTTARRRNRRSSRHHHDNAEDYSHDSGNDDELEDHPMITLSRPSLDNPQRPSVPPLNLHQTLHHNQDTESAVEEDEAGNELSGIYLGILNVFACLPQFVATFISFVVFSVLEPGRKGGEGSGEGGLGEGGLAEGKEGGVNAIAVVMGIGGVSVLVAAHYTVRLKSL
ncbi:major facilitator superfamily domain-containing protein [Peziza echinospora]|nr:major facilitator superfamily domain-containing protein [Peziza echinospora]